MDANARPNTTPYRVIAASSSTSTSIASVCSSFPNVSRRRFYAERQREHETVPSLQLLTKVSRTMESRSESDAFCNSSPNVFNPRASEPSKLRRKAWLLIAARPSNAPWYRPWEETTCRVPRIPVGVVDLKEAGEASAFCNVCVTPIVVWEGRSASHSR